jgi:tetratricopeptide (TPR) repeat protein
MQHTLSLSNDQALLAGRAHLRARRWRDADALAMRWLQRQPASAEAAALRAMVGLANGQTEAAQELINAALALNSQSAFAYFALAQLYLAQSQPEPAESSLRQALRLAPEDAEAHSLLASLWAARGEADAAQQHIRSALQLVPDSALLHLNLAELLQALGQLEAAAASASAGLALEPSLARGWLVAAEIATQQGLWLYARQCCEQALLLEPENPTFLTELARVLVLAGSQPAAHPKLLADAEQTARQALVLMPKSFAAQLMLGGALRGIGRTDEALAVQAALVRIAPQDPVPTLEIALTLRKARRLDAALLAVEHALQLAPDAIPAQLIKSDILLLQGDVPAAFAALDKLDELLRPGPARLAAPCTAQSVGGKTILLQPQTAQQLLLFARYVPPLAALGAQVSIATDPLLHPLLQTLQGLHQRLPPEADPKDFDYVEPMQRLPLLLPTVLPTVLPHGIASPPWGGPFCGCNSHDLTYLQEQFAALPARRIGLDLGPNPDTALAALLAPMFKALGVTVVTLSALAQTEPLFDSVALEVAHTSHPATLATLVRALDLIICVDTLTAHIAGAMGVPCHLLLPLEHEALWGATGEQTNWYPATHLYRQSPPNTWQPCVTSLHQRLLNTTKQQTT